MIFQSSIINRAGQGAIKVNENIAGMSQGAEETGSASSQVTSAAGKLCEQSELLKSTIDGFMIELKKVV